MLNNPLPYFESMIDPRRSTKNKLHPLESIIFITLCATLCGYDDWVSIEDFAQEQQDWFKQHIDLPHGIPSHDTLSNVIGRLNRVAFSQVLSQWMTDSLPELKDKHIAIDGKTTGGKIGDAKSITLVTAFATQARLVLASTEVDKKTNEIKAIPALLELIEMKGSIVSMDAIYCQKDICRQLVAKEADYVLSLKKNHSTLYEDVSLYLETKFKHQQFEIKEEIEKGHGRIEVRRYALSTDIDWLDSKENWIGLKAIGMVESIREINGKQEKQLRYYLTSLTDLTKFSEVVRGHWCIENQQHWVLDVIFGEDGSRAYTNNQRSNLAAFRRISLNLLQSVDDKLSIKRRRIRAAMNPSYRESIIFQKQCS
jgi:predicted transposase YbfD/YdcC